MLSIQIKSILRNKVNIEYVIAIIVIFVFLNIGINLTKVVDYFYDTKVKEFMDEESLYYARSLSISNPQIVLTEEQQETYLSSVRRTRLKTLLMTTNIDKAIDEMAKRRKAAGRELEYQVFDMYFMQGMSYEQIIDQVEKDTGERLGKNTPRRWVTGIINEMPVLLWGLEDERQ